MPDLSFEEYKYVRRSFCTNESAKRAMALSAGALTARETPGSARVGGQSVPVRPPTSFSITRITTTSYRNIPW